MQADDEAEVTKTRYRRWCSVSGGDDVGIKLDRTAPQQQEIEEGEVGWLGKKRNVSKSPGDEKSRIRLIVCGKCDGMKGGDVERVGGGHGGLVEEWNAQDRRGDLLQGVAVEATQGT